MTESKLNNTVSEEKLNKYFAITGEAFEMAKAAPVKETSEKEVAEILDMVSRYISDAEHFKERGDWTLAFAALNYAHGWLDCGARLGLFIVKDSRLFTVDDE